MNGRDQVMYTMSGKPARPAVLIIAIAAIGVGLILSIPTIFQGIDDVSQPAYNQPSPLWHSVTWMMLIAALATFVLLALSLAGLITGFGWGRVLAIATVAASTVFTVVVLSQIISVGEALGSTLLASLVSIAIVVLLCLPPVSAYLTAMKAWRADRAAQRG